MTRQAALRVLLALLPMVAACQDYGGLEICNVTYHSGVTVTGESIRIPRGVAVAIKALPLKDNGDYKDHDTDVALYSENEAVLGLDRLRLLDPDEHYDNCAVPAAKRWYFVLYGAERGTTEVTVSMEGDRVDTIPVEVY